MKTDTNHNPYEEIIQELVKEKSSMADLIRQILNRSLSLCLAKYPEVIKDDPSIQAKLNINIETYKSPEFGHLSTTLPLELSKILQRNPIEIGETLIQEILTNPESIIFEKITNIRGFVNFYLKIEFVMYFLQEKIKQDFIGKSLLLKSQKVLVEHTDANPFKEPHIGHLMNNIIGESVYRLIQSQSAETYNICYQGDVGMHVAKTIYGILKNIEKNTYSLEDFLRSNQDNCIEYLNYAYQYGSKLYESSEEDKKQIQDLNLVVFQISQEIPKSKGIKVVNKYETPENFKTNYDTIYQIYFKGRTESLNHFKEIVSTFGTFFDEQYFESVTGEIGTDVVRNSNIFEESEEAIIWNGKKFDRNVQVIINQFGIPIYGCKDIGLSYLKTEKYHPDTFIIVTAEEQKFYFRDMFEIFRQLGLSKNFKHISHGQLNLSGGKKMSSRKGTIITIRELLRELENEVNLKFSSNKDQKTLENKSEKIAISCIKYLILKSNPGTNITFDYEKSLQLTGNTGPYLLYTFARCQSLLKKGGAFELENFAINPNPSEKEVLLNALFFEEAVSKSATEYNPAVLANYLNQIAQVFNKFYNDNSILGASSDEEQNFRLFITLLTATIINRGCYLLGFETLDEL